MGCPICNSPNINHFHNYGHFTLLECSNCGLAFQDPNHRADLDRVLINTYDDSWVAMRNAHAASTLREHSFFNIMLLEAFCGSDTGDSLLEVGSGTGEFGFLAGAAGWDFVGLEQSPQACAYAKNRYGIDLVNGKNLDAVSRNFDVACFWHTLEHILDPIGFLTEIKQKVRPGGYIAFSVPNHKSHHNETVGLRSDIYTEADHVFHYTKNSIPFLLNRVGLEKVSIMSRQNPDSLGGDTTSKIHMAAKLQSVFKGFELFCVARNPDYV